MTLEETTTARILHAEQIHRIHSFRSQGERIIARAYLNATGTGHRRGIPHPENTCRDEASVLIREHVAQLDADPAAIEQFYDDLLTATDAALIREYRLLRESGMNWYLIWTLADSLTLSRLYLFIKMYRHPPAIPLPQNPASRLLDSYLNS